MKLVDNVIDFQEEVETLVDMGGTVVKLPRFDAEEVLTRVGDDITPDTKLFCFYENDDGDLSVASCKFTAVEILWALESLKMSLMSGRLGS